MPFVIAIVPGVGFGAVVQAVAKGSSWAALPREVGLVAGLVAAVAWTWMDGGIRRTQMRRILLDPKMVKMWATVGGVFVFKGVIETGGAAQEMGRALLQLEIPFGWVAVILPMIVGVISGLPIAFVGTCFPILISVLETMGAAQAKLPWIILGFVSGFTGSLLAPTHLCLILSNEYFRAPWSDVYSHLWLPVLLLLALGIGYFWALRTVLSWAF